MGLFSVNKTSSILLFKLNSGSAKTIEFLDMSLDFFLKLISSLPVVKSRKFLSSLKKFPSSESLKAAKGTLFKWMFDYVFSPMSATMFSLLAFFVASASYRAFRIRNFEATLLLVSGIIIMVGRVPIGGVISSWFIMYLIVLLLGIYVNSIKKDKKVTFIFLAVGLSLVTIAGTIMGWPIDQPGIFYLPSIQEWIYYYPNVAGARAIMIGIGLGIFATSIRYILGIERSYIGE